MKESGGRKAPAGFLCQKGVLLKTGQAGKRRIKIRKRSERKKRGITVKNENGIRRGVTDLFLWKRGLRATWNM